MDYPTASDHPQQTLGATFGGSEGVCADGQTAAGRSQQVFSVPGGVSGHDDSPQIADGFSTPRASAPPVRSGTASHNSPSSNERSPQAKRRTGRRRDRGAGVPPGRVPSPHMTPSPAGTKRVREQSQRRVAESPSTESPSVRTTAVPAVGRDYKEERRRAALLKGDLCTHTDVSLRARLMSVCACVHVCRDCLDLRGHHPASA
jgi:hypothetical protein